MKREQSSRLRRFKLTVKGTEAFKALIEGKTLLHGDVYYKIMDGITLCYQREKDVAWSLCLSFNANLQYTIHTPELSHQEAIHHYNNGGTVSIPQLRHSTCNGGLYKKPNYLVNLYEPDEYVDEDLALLTFDLAHKRNYKMYKGE